MNLHAQVDHLKDGIIVLTFPDSFRTTVSRLVVLEKVETKRITFRQPRFRDFLRHPRLRFNWKYKIEEGALHPPWCYGYAYTEYDTMHSVWWLIPLNYIIYAYREIGWRWNRFRSRRFSSARARATFIAVQNAKKTIQIWDHIDHYGDGATGAKDSGSWPGYFTVAVAQLREFVELVSK